MQDNINKLTTVHPRFARESETGVLFIYLFHFLIYIKFTYLWEKEKVMNHFVCYLIIGTLIYGSIMALVVAWMLHAKEKDNIRRYTD